MCQREFGFESEGREQAVRDKMEERAREKGQRDGKRRGLGVGEGRGPISAQVFNSSV